ncbi:MULTISPECIES: hypothetical protein [Exiguobacterium]|uniref:hypothetical protein n=1 Tax=Exiguobacterium TaxID=33986 RepID=UPI001BEB4CAC|nr:MULTISPECIES: hypothetical protein [Exiguobacterium]MCT4782969.1 hypothetical protein [Exiguobacterium himgiriensis]
MNLLKLVGWEVERVTKPYLILISLLVVTQFAWLGYFLWSETAFYEEMRRTGTPDYVLTFSNYIGGTPFILSIGFAVTAMLMYSFWIWYRDFQGRGTFMMRLLMIPQQRMFVFTAKLFTMMLMVLGLFSIQWIVLKIEYIAFTNWFNSQMMPISGSFERAISFDGALAIMFPASLFNFFVHQIVIVLVILFIFTFVLIERSLWQHTIWASVFAGLKLVGILAVPIIGYFFIEKRLIYDETLLFIGGVLVSMFFMTVWMIRHYLTKKLNV